MGNFWDKSFSNLKNPGKERSDHDFGRFQLKDNHWMICLVNQSYGIKIDKTKIDKCLPTKALFMYTLASPQKNCLIEGIPTKSC